MVSPPVAMGISHFGYAFGVAEKVPVQADGDAGDRREFHRAADGVYAVDLAAEAARQVLAQASLDAGALGIIAMASSQLPEYLYWDSSAALAKALDVTRVQTMLFSNEGCGVGLTGLGRIAGIMAIQPDVETALLVVVNRVSDFHRNRLAVLDSVDSDGAVAILLRRGHPRLRWLATEWFTDPAMCDWFRNDYGGVVTPIPPPEWRSDQPVNHEKVHAHFGNDPQRLRAFMTERDQRVVEVIHAACHRAGASPDEISHLIYLNDSRPGVIESLSGRLGVPDDRTNAELARQHGHMGAADQLVSLGLLDERGELAEGDLVALCGISTGMQWYATLVRV